MIDLRANPARAHQFDPTIGCREAVWLLRIVGPDGEELSCAFAPEPGIGPGAIVDGMQQHGITVKHMIPVSQPIKRGGN